MRNPRGPRFSLLTACVLALSASPCLPAPNETCPAMAEGASRLARTGSESFASGAGFCLSCHDGTVARTILARSRAAFDPSKSRRSPAVAAALVTNVSLDGTRSSNHVVDVGYPDGNPKFHPLAAVQLRLPLPGGRVTCDTCHSGSNPDASDLTISNVGSALCLTCHVK